MHINCYFHILIDHSSLEILCMLSSPCLQEPGLLQLVKALLCRATTFEGLNSNSLLPYFVYGPGNNTLEISTHVTSSYGFSGIYGMQEKNTILKEKLQIAVAVIQTHRYYRCKFFKDNCRWFWKQMGHIQYVFHLTFTWPGCCQ